MSDSNKYATEEKDHDGRGAALRTERLEVPCPPNILQNKLNNQYSQTAMRSSFKERLISQTFLAQQEANRFNRLERLIKLLDKHPDIAEIFDLMDALELR